jgi:hypothetical protein
VKDAKDYIDATRARIDADLAAYKKLGSPPKAFEHAFFNNMVLALDCYFVHRVRVLAGSRRENGGVMTANKTIKMKPDETVLGCEFGDQIEVNAEGFGAPGRQLLRRAREQVRLGRRYRAYERAPGSSAARRGACVRRARER